MPKAARYVEYNDGGTWSYALVKSGDGGNLNLIVKSEGSGGWEMAGNVPQGNESGNWREPQD